MAVVTFNNKINNIRRWKSINKGVYVMNDIKLAEKYTQSIIIGDKIYKILFMVKVKISEIVEQKNSKFWILDDKYIRVYRIIFKRIK